MKKQVHILLWTLLLMLCPLNIFAQFPAPVNGIVGHYYLNYCGYDEPLWGRSCGYSDKDKQTGEYKQKSISAMVYFPTDTIKKFVGGKCIGVRIGVSAEVKDAVVFVRRDYRDISKKIASKKLNLQPGWNEVLFDTPVDLPEGEALTVGYDFDNTIQNDHSVMTVSKQTHDVSEYAAIMSINGKKPELYTRYIGCFYIEAVISEKPDVTENKMRVTSLRHGYGLDKEGKTKIYYNVQNLGSNKITSIEGNILSDGKKVADINQSVSIIPLQNVMLEQDGILVKNGQPLSVVLNKINGVDVAPITMSVMVEGCISQKYKRTALVEEFTTENCGNCPRATTIVHKVLDREEFRDNVVFVAHHTGYGKDNFTFDFDELFLGLFGNKYESFAPSISVNRRFSMLADVNTPAHRVGNEEEVAAYFKEGVEHPAAATINLVKTIDLKKRSMHVEITGNVLPEYVAKDALYVNLYVVEDEIFTNTQTGAKGSFTHQGVIRQVVTKPEGSKISFGQDGAYTYSVDTQLPELSNWDHIRLVAFVGNKMIAELPKGKENICEVYNATQVPVSEFVSVEDVQGNDVKVFVADGSVQVEGNASIQAIYTMDGKMVANENLVGGAYIIRVATPSGMISKKFVVK